MLGRKWVAEKNEVRYLAEKVKLGISILLPEALPAKPFPPEPYHPLRHQASETFGLQTALQFKVYR
jgi:hypothetical protein